MKPKKLLLSISQLPLVFSDTPIGWFRTLDLMDQLAPQARMELEVPKVAQKKIPEFGWKSLNFFCRS